METENFKTMKKKLIVLTFIVFLIMSSSTEIQADACTRAWANAFNTISSQYTNALVSCWWDIVKAWATYDPMINIGCANEAFWNYSVLLDGAAGQYEACYM